MAVYGVTDADESKPKWAVRGSGVVSTHDSPQDVSSQGGAGSGHSDHGVH